MLGFFHMLMLKVAENPLEKLDIDVPALTKAFHALVDKFIQVGMMLLSAIIVFIIGYLIIVLVRKIVKKLLSGRRISRSMRSFVNSTVNIFLKALLILAVLRALGVESASFAALIATFGLAFGLAAKDNLSNFASGIMILFFKPFSVCDRVVIQGVDGTIEAIGFLFVTIKTMDGQVLYIPNSKIMTDKIYNYSEISTRRLDLAYIINFGYATDVVIDSIRKIVKANKRVESVPEPFADVTEVRESSYIVTIRVWVTQDNYGAAQNELNKAVFTRLEAMGVYKSSVLSVSMQTQVDHTGSDNLAGADNLAAADAAKEDAAKPATRSGTAAKTTRSSRGKSANKQTGKK